MLVFFNSGGIVEQAYNKKQRTVKNTLRRIDLIIGDACLFSIAILLSFSFFSSKGMYILMGITMK
jgi:hypothetical protein